MKREYSSPVMEVEVFEASEYIATCYRCYSPGSETSEGSEQSQRGIKKYNLYLDSNGNKQLEFEQDRGISIFKRCSDYGESFNVNPNEVETGFWYGHIFEDPDVSKYREVNVLKRDGKYHIVTNNGANHS